MDVIFTKEASYLEQWDAFIDQSTQANHLQFSDWLQSYVSYGFDFEVGLLLDNGILVGGFGAVIPKFSFFKFYIVPNGPIVKDGADAEVFETLLSAIANRAKTLKCCYCQFNQPLTIRKGGQFSEPFSVPHLFKKGSLFKYVYTSEGINWLDFSKYTSEAEILQDFKSSVRRDIRSSERKGQEVFFLTEEKDIRAAYQLCEDNARRAGYSLRSWSDFSATILNLIVKKRAKFMAAYKDDEIKGAVFLVKSGNYYTYIFGGAKRETPDLLSGHFLQWEALTMAFREGCVGYNISLGGSDGVKSFKGGFNVTPILAQEAKYYLVLNSLTFNLFLFFEQKIKPYKGTIAKLLSKKNK